MEFFDETSNDTYDSIGVIRYFKCSGCDKIADYSDDNGKCWDCSPDSDD
jgi:hypothetical protein